MLLLTLPAEIQLLIASFLSAPEKQLLRSTCRHYHNFLPGPSVLDLQEILMSAYNFKMYGLCLRDNCRRLYPRDNWDVEAPVFLNEDGWYERTSRYTCTRCQYSSAETPFVAKVEGDYRRLLENNYSARRSREEQRTILRKLRDKQGLGNGFWDKLRHETVLPYAQRVVRRY